MKEYLKDIAGKRTNITALASLAASNRAAQICSYIIDEHMNNNLTGQPSVGGRVLVGGAECVSTGELGNFLKFPLLAMCPKTAMFTTRTCAVFDYGM